MSKNKKIVIASVGVLCILISAVLFIRSPGTKTIPEQPVSIEQSTEVDTPAPSQKKPDRDESHKKVEKVIDQASNAVVETVPGIWARLKDTGEWFMAFDTKHALILLGFCIFVCAVLLGNKNKQNRR